MNKLNLNNNPYSTGTLNMDGYTVWVGFDIPKVKSHLKIGNMVIYNTHHFNWLERKMWKLLLGFDIENVEGNKNEIN